MGHIQRRNILEIFDKTVVGAGRQIQGDKLRCVREPEVAMDRTEQPQIQLALLCCTRPALAWNVVVDDIDVDGAAGVDLLVGVDVEPALGCNSIDI